MSVVTATAHKLPGPRRLTPAVGLVAVEVLHAEEAMQALVVARHAVGRRPVVGGADGAGLRAEAEAVAHESRQVVVDLVEVGVRQVGQALCRVKG